MAGLLVSENSLRRLNLDRARRRDSQNNHIRHPLDDKCAQDLEILRIEFDYNVLEQFAKHAYIAHAPIVVSGFLHRSLLDGRNAQSPSSKIFELCRQYYYEPEQATFQLAYELWLGRNEIYLQFVHDMVVETHSFNGIRLINHIKHFLVPFSRGKSDQEILQMCNDLIRYKMIERKNCNDAEMDSISKDGYEVDHGITAHTKSDPRIDLVTDYQFKWYRHRQFVKASQPDRRSWSRGSRVEVFSESLGGWQQGTVLQINRNLLTVAYGQSYGQRHFNGQMGSHAMRKEVHRYDETKIRSCPISTIQRLDLRAGSQVYVYSKQQKMWCAGHVDEVLEINRFNVLRVSYRPARPNSNFDDDRKEALMARYKSKFVHRWSSQMRLASEMDEAFTTAEEQPIYRKGTKVQVYSITKRRWIDGVIAATIPAYQLINVRYANSEKLISINSHHFRLGKH